MLQVHCYLSIQENNSKALKAPSRVEVFFLRTIVVSFLITRSRYHSYPIQPRNLYILRRKEIITITITTTIHVSLAVTWEVTCFYPASTISRRTTSHLNCQPTTADKYYAMTAGRKPSGISQISYIWRKDRGSECIYQCSSLIFEYKDDRRDEGNKDSLGAILCIRRSS